MSHTMIGLVCDLPRQFPVETTQRDSCLPTSTQSDRANRTVTSRIKKPKNVGTADKVTKATVENVSWASSEGVHRSMKSNRPRNTKPELALRSALHAEGLRFRKHFRPVPGSRCEVDVAFTRWKVVVQLDGCFWHGCPEHGSLPKTNHEWWAAKFDRNLERDKRLDQLLSEHGWTVLRFWEHEPIDDVVIRIIEALTSKQRERYFSNLV